MNDRARAGYRDADGQGSERRVDVWPIRRDLNGRP